MDERVLQRVLVVATGVLLVAGVLSAAIVGAGDGDDDRLATSGRPSATTTTTPAATDGGALGGAGATGSPAAPGAPVAPRSTAPVASNRGSGGAAATTTTVAAIAADDAFRDLGPVDDAGATAVPGVGSYHYRFTAGDGDSHDATTKVEDRQAASNGGRNLVVSYSGEGLDIVNDVVWGPTQVHYTKTTFVFGSNRIECDWQPDYVFLDLSLARGRTWSVETSCSAQFGVTPTTIKRTTTTKVTDARRVHVAGTDVLTWVLEASDHFEFPGATTDTQETTWFAPKLGLPVRQTGTTTSKGQGDEPPTTSEIVILDVKPS
jgi:hypothetical protein